MSKLPDGWRLVKLKEILRQERRKISVVPDQFYSQIGIRSHGKGIFHKEPVTGEQLASKQVFWVEPGDFVVNIVFAWEDAVALVSENERGMCASHRFPTFIVDPDQCDSRYLLRYFQSKDGINQLGSVSPGGAGRNKTLNRSAFLKLDMPLPPLAEQRRIAEILGAWDDAITLTGRLINALKRRKQRLTQLLLNGQMRFQDFGGQEWQQVKLRDIATVNPPKSNSFNNDTLVSFVTMADVSEDAQLINSTDRRYEEVREGFTSFQNGDVLVAKITPCFENGKGAFVSGLTNGVGFGSTEFHIVRADSTQTLPSFLYYHLTEKEFRGRGEQNMVGSAGQKRVPTSYLRDYQMMLPSLEEQSAITNILGACDTEIAILQEILTTYQQEKKGLMQRLLTGQTRTG